jgi:hypothetical protein
MRRFPSIPSTSATPSIRTPRRHRIGLGVGAAVALLVALVVAPTGAGSQSPSRHAFLTDVTVGSTATADQVVFTFAGDVLPADYQVDPVEPPFRDIPGNEIPVAGSAFLRVWMPGATGVNFGFGCAPLPAPTPGPGEELVSVYWSCFVPGTPGASPVASFGRVVPAGDDQALLTAAVESLLAGPTASEQAAGASSLFSAATAGLLLDLTLAPDGSVTVNFDPSLATILTNASASAASEQLLRELDATVFLRPGVTGAEYQLGGSCDDFFAWLQRPCTPRTVDDAASALYAETYLGPDRVTGDTEVVTEVVETEDFEANLVWVIGLDQETTYTVTTLTDPARLVVEIAHPPAAPATATPARPTFTG